MGWGQAVQTPSIQILYLSLSRADITSMMSCTMNAGSLLLSQENNIQSAEWTLIKPPGAHQWTQELR